MRVIASLLLLLLCWVPCTSSFSLSSPKFAVRRFSTRLFEVDQGLLPGYKEGVFDLDDASWLTGGVGLAMESALKMEGDVNFSSEGAEADVEDMTAFKTIQKVDESTLKSALAKVDGDILITTVGEEIYFDPGETTEKKVQYASDHAILQALDTNPAVEGAHKVAVNFLGGGDLQCLEVVQAAEKLADKADFDKKTKLRYTSVSYKDFPEASVTATIVAIKNYDEDVIGELSGVEKSIAMGEIFSRDGVYYALSEKDITREDEFFPATDSAEP